MIIILRFSVIYFVQYYVITGKARNRLYLCHHHHHLNTGCYVTLYPYLSYAKIILFLLIFYF